MNNRRVISKPQTSSPSIIWPKKTTNKPQGMPPTYAPIIVDHLPNWSHHFQVLSKELGRPVNAKAFGTGIKFSPADEQENENIQAIIDLESNLLPSKFNLRVAVKGLFMNTELSLIRKALIALGYDVKRVNKGTLTGKRRLFLVDLKRTTGLTSSIYDIKKLLLRSVVIEPNMGLYGYKYNTYPCHQMLWKIGNKLQKFGSPQSELDRIQNSPLPKPKLAIQSSNDNQRNVKEEDNINKFNENALTNNIQGIGNSLNKNQAQEASSVEKPDLLVQKVNVVHPKVKPAESSTSTTDFEKKGKPAKHTTSTANGVEIAIRAVNTMLLAIQKGTKPETAAVEAIMKFIDRDC